MRLFSFQAKEFWSIISENFGNGAEVVDNETIDNLIHRTKEVYGDNQFLYAFTGRYIQGQWSFLFSSLFQTYSAMFSYYRFWDVINDGAVLVELEVPDNEVILRELSQEMKLEAMLDGVYVKVY